MREIKEVKVLVADPSALGLFGLAVITLVASSQKLGITSSVSLVIPWAIFLGATAFGVYALFWYSMGMTWLIQNGVFGEKLAQSADTKQLGFAFLAYLIFTLFMTIGAMKTHKILLIIFILIDFLFIGLALNAFDIMSHFAHELAAYSELGIALFSFYGCGAAVLNAHFGKVFLPVGKL